jgi:hypothetical protein
MDCRKFQRQLEDYLEGGLDFPGRFGMERHARQCFGCGQELSGAQKLGQMARDLKRASAPPDFEVALLRRIHAQRPHSRFFSLRRFWVYGFDHPSWRLVALAGTALMLLGLGVFLAVHRAGYDQQTPAAWLPDNSASVPSRPDVRLAVETPAKAETVKVGRIAPVTLSPPQVRAGLSADEDRFAGQIEASDYGEYLVPGFGGRKMTVRLPNTIRMQYGQVSEDYYIRNVSH